MFSRRSPRRRRASGLGSLSQKVRSHWSGPNVDRVFDCKRSFSRRLSMEALEDRHLLAVNVFFSDVTSNFTIVDDFVASVLEDPFTQADHVQEDNLVTLSNGIDTPGRLRITDPRGVILDPINAGMGTQINDT